VNLNRRKKARSHSVAAIYSHTSAEDATFLNFSRKYAVISATGALYPLLNFEPGRYLRYKKALLKFAKENAHKRKA
jgi:hypothetical protein